MHPTWNGKALFRWQKCLLKSSGWMPNWPTMPTQPLWVKWCMAAPKAWSILLWLHLAQVWEAELWLMERSYSAMMVLLVNWDIPSSAMKEDCTKELALKDLSEAYASATGVERDGPGDADQVPGRDSLLREYSINDLTSQSVYECAMKGDKIANEIFEFTIAEILGEALANFIMFFTRSHYPCLAALQRQTTWYWTQRGRRWKITWSRYLKTRWSWCSWTEEADAAILGASALVCQEWWCLTPAGCLTHKSEANKPPPW